MNEEIKQLLDVVISEHEELTYDKPIEEWETFFVIKKTQKAGNP